MDSDLVVDVLNAVALRRKERHAVVHRIDAQQRRLADPVAHPCVADLGPEGLVVTRRNRVQPHVRETGDARVPRREEPTARVCRPQHQLDRVAARVLEGDERLHAPLLAFALRARAHHVPGSRELGCCELELARRLQLEADHVIKGVTLVIGQGVITIVGAQVRATGIAAHELESQDRDGITHGRIQIGRAETHIAQVLQSDHRPSSRALVPPMPQCSLGTSWMITRMLSGLACSACGDRFVDGADQRLLLLGRPSFEDLDLGDGHGGLFAVAQVKPTDTEPRCS